MSKVIASSSDDKKWMREDDARTLAYAEEIKADTKRHKAAVKEASIIVKEREKSVTALKKVAGKSIPSKPAPKPKSAPKPASKSNTSSSSKRRK